MQEINNSIEKFPKERIWLFNSAGTFSGNVKYLFVYITKYRKDIFACYITGDENNLNYIRSLGFRACLFKSKEGKFLMEHAGVYVNEDVKEHYPEELLNTKLLNLFHGVGLKSIERKWKREYLGIKIAKKYIQYNEYIINNMCFLVTSPFMEQHFKEQLHLSNKQIIRSGYPRCVYQKNYEPIHTYNVEFLNIKNKSNNTQIALYAPTYRENNPENFLYRAIKDIYTLIDILIKNNILLIIKLHPKIKNDFFYNEIKQIANVSNNILLWDNKYDIYEIFDKIDIAIIDYSSIYYDLVAVGVKKFIRYIFDYDDENKFLLYDYFENTSGTVCKDFNELLEALDSPIAEEDCNKLNKIKDKFWLYLKDDTCEDIIKQTLNFSIQNIKLHELYSFDIFDTIISRKVLQPRGIFYYVMEKIKNSYEEFPDIFNSEYVAIRMQAEANIREYIKKTKGNYEITFDAIFNRLSEIYHLSINQINLLKKWEIEAEFDNIIPNNDKILFAEQLINDGEQVILISDMYLSKEIINKFIYKISPILAKVPLFVSSEYTVQKSTQKLYLEVYRYFDPYLFKKWNHYGDNKIVDGDMARKIGIIPHIHNIPCFNAYEQSFINRCKDYDSYLFSGMLARTRTKLNLTEKEYFAFAHIGCYFTPYIAWVIRDALLKGYETLYFISRDGYILKKAADKFIELHNIKIKTKYIYGSRRAWRIPSQIDSIDDEFFSEFGNFVGVDNYEKLLSALHISDHKFQKLFSELNISNKTKITSEKLVAIRLYFKNSQKYKEYLLSKANQERNLVIKYLIQEINFTEKFAFVEFWGRGYTQSTLCNLLSKINNKIICNCYYFRSILPSQGNNIRYNFSTNNTSLLFIEAIFANHPFSTVYGYQEKNGKIIPIMKKEKFDAELYYNIDIYLKKFIDEFYSINFLQKINKIERICSDISLYWYRDHQDDPTIVKSIGHLLDSVELYGDIREFAPEFNHTIIELIKHGKSPNSLTRSLKISLARSTPEIRSEFKSISNNITNKSIPVKLLSRKVRLLAKFERNPKAFFSDSHNNLVKFIGKIYFIPILHTILKKGIVFIIKKYIGKEK